MKQRRLVLLAALLLFGGAVSVTARAETAVPAFTDLRAASGKPDAVIRAYPARPEAVESR